MVVYQFDTDPAPTPAEVAFNEDVVRITQDPQARHRNGLDPVPPTTGDLRIPMLTLHNLGDLFVPFLNEVVYAERVAEKGNSEMLVQRAVGGVGHCDFTAAAFGGAFLELAAWVEYGVQPDGDVVLDPAAVPDPDYGCKFTVGAHVLGTPCP